MICAPFFAKTKQHPTDSFTDLVLQSWELRSGSLKIPYIDSIIALAFQKWDYTVPTEHFIDSKTQNNGSTFLNIGKFCNELVRCSFKVAERERPWHFSFRFPYVLLVTSGYSFRKKSSCKVIGTSYVGSRYVSLPFTYIPHFPSSHFH